MLGGAGRHISLFAMTFPPCFSRCRLLLVAFIFSGLVWARASIDAERALAPWPAAPEAQLREEIFGLRFLTKYSRSPEAGRKFLTEAWTKTQSTEANAYVGSTSLFAKQWNFAPIVNEAVAESLLELAYREGSLVAATDLGRAKVYGVGIGRDEEAGAKLIEEAAGKGFPAAIGELGVLHGLGLGGCDDVAYGEKLVRQAFALGAEGGLRTFADGVETGRVVVPQPQQKAMELYRLLAENNYTIGWRKLDEYVEKRVPRAAYFRALTMVRYANLTDNIAPSRVTQRLRDLEESPDLEGEGQAELGIAYLTGAFLKKDYPKALKFLQHSAEAGVGDAKLYLAYAKVMGKGMARDPATALAEMEALAAAGNGRAALVLANCYYWAVSEIPGLKKDPVKTFNYCRQAARAGYMPAFPNLGMCYEHAIGTEKNNVLSVKARAVVAFRNDVDSINQLNRTLSFIKN